ncbi:MAG: HAD-IIIA family hydrolase [Ignavibacteria bacterium]|nr:HAD-IIIA family hydrolase [Ignavibacteria bacterium]
MGKTKAVFFDRDGVVNYRIVGEYIKDKDNFHFIPDFLIVLPRIRFFDYKLILVSNQKGVGKGLMSQEELHQIDSFMNKILMDKFGFCFDDVYYCVDASEKESNCLKPSPAMLLEAIGKWGIEPSQSWMVGDKEKDIIAGKRAGVKTVLIGISDEVINENPDYRLNNLYDFIKLLEQWNKR